MSTQNAKQTPGQDYLQRCEADIREFAYAVCDHLPYKPNDEQLLVLGAFGHFLFRGEERSLLLINGYAGTGKTTLIGAVVKQLKRLHRSVILLAPTGRAAQIFSENAGHSASTIHRCIYRQEGYMEQGYRLGENKRNETIYIVDEASMIANTPTDGSQFGSGHLLDDLMRYVYNGNGKCRLVFMGDQAQLPPVGLLQSPALDANVLRGYDLRVYDMHLTRVSRQAAQSGILSTATMLRRRIAKGELGIPEIDADEYEDLQAITSEYLLELISDSYNEVGEDETIVITRSNKRASQYNSAIRNRILYREDELCTGDMLIVAKNNYYWTRGNRELDFIANGDVLCVERIWGEEVEYGYRFANATVSLPDHGNAEIDVKLILDNLASDAPALTMAEQDAFASEILGPAQGSKKTQFITLTQDDYYNALQVKYAYALTCHKAQGGQWEHVYIDMGGIAEEALQTEDFYRWFYTALTRARNQVYLINCPFANYGF